MPMPWEIVRETAPGAGAYEPYLIADGKVAMWTDASVFYGQIVDPAKTQLGADKVGIANFPAGPKTNSPFIVITLMALSWAKHCPPPRRGQWRHD